MDPMASLCSLERVVRPGEWSRKWTNQSEQRRSEGGDQR